MKTTGCRQFLLLFLPLMFLPLAPAGAFDFNLVSNNYFGALHREDSDTEYEYRLDTLPSILFFLGDKGELFSSLRLSFGRDKLFTGKKEYLFIFTPELMRTEISLRLGNWEINAGRTNNTDPSGFYSHGAYGRHPA
jgi:hypothetical protein